jgi:hypothetical protein
MSANIGPLLFSLVCGGFFALVAAGLGVFFLVFSLRSQKKTRDSQSWPTTGGQITAASVVTSESAPDDDGRTYPLYYPLVKYEYTLNGQDYTSDRLAFGGRKTFKRHDQAAQEMAHYPVGKAVTLHYNPADPGEAVLETKQVIGSRLSMILGVILVLISVCILCPLTISLVRNLTAG